VCELSPVTTFVELNLLAFVMVNGAI